jgi:hypothetical protein
MIMDCVCTNTVIAQPTSVKFSAGTVTALATRPTQMPALHSRAARAARAPCLYRLCRRHHCCRCASAHLRSSGRGRRARAMRARHFVPPLPALGGSRRCAASALRGLGAARLRSRVGCGIAAFSVTLTRARRSGLRGVLRG